MSDVYDFPVTSYTVTDGDTYHLGVIIREGASAFRVTVGPDTAVPEVRLDGYDCPEKRSSATRRISAKERAAAHVAERMAGQWFDRHTAHPGGVRVHTERDPEKWGRWLGDVYCDSCQHHPAFGHLGTWLASLDLAVEYHGKSSEPRWWEVHDQPVT